MYRFLKHVVIDKQKRYLPYTQGTEILYIEGEGKCLSARRKENVQQ